MLTKAGAKLMDFGLARATGLAGPAGRSGITMKALTQSPTIAAPLTSEGTIVGTFQYMAPEQLEGKEADARSDLWALGCVLYEMATGKRAFEAKSQASLIASILEHEPAPISAVQPMVPPALERVVRACLAKDPEERIQTAHDVKLQLQWIGGETSQSNPALAHPSPIRGLSRARERVTWALALAAITPLAFLARQRMVADRVVRSTRFSAPAPPGIVVPTPSSTTISPDGTMLAYAGFDSGGSRLWIRPLDALEPREIPGTQGAALPFWSPDSRTIGFFSGGKLKKVPGGGGPVEVLCDAENARGGTWNRQGVILFSPSGGRAALPRVVQRRRTSAGDGPRQRAS